MPLACAEKLYISCVLSKIKLQKFARFVSIYLPLSTIYMHISETTLLLIHEFLHKHKSSRFE